MSSKLKLTASTGSTLWGEPTGLGVVAIKSGLLGAVLIEREGELGELRWQLQRASSRLLQRVAEDYRRANGGRQRLFAFVCPNKNPVNVERDDRDEFTGSEH